MAIPAQAGFTFLLLARWFLASSHATFAMVAILDGILIQSEQRAQRLMLAVTFTLIAGALLHQDEQAASAGREYWVLPR